MKTITVVKVGSKSINYSSFTDCLQNWDYLGGWYYEPQAVI